MMYHPHTIQQTNSQPLQQMHQQSNGHMQHQNNNGMPLMPVSSNQMPIGMVNNNNSNGNLMMLGNGSNGLGVGASNGMQSHHHHHNHHQHIETKTELIVPEVDKEKEKQARENHCEIERRRRVKMAAYFNELCQMVPTCNSLTRKPDKLTILRMASSHMRNLRGNNSNLGNTNDSAYKPSFLTDQELKHLILEAADGFLFVAQCDTGNIIYVSDAVQPVLSYSPNEWTHRTLFDFIHPDDLEKVKDQLSTQENSSNNTSGRILDLKTGTVKKEGHPNSMRSHIGSRRSFICRIKLGSQTQYNNQYNDNQQIIDPATNACWSTAPRSNRNRNTLQSNLDLASDPLSQPYSVIHITGYTKVWPPNSSTQSSSSSNNMQLIDHSGHQQQQMYNQHYGMMGGHMENGQHAQPITNFHLIAIARIQMTSAPSDLVHSSNSEFITRHDQNGVITFVDQRIIPLLGYQPNEMLKKPIYDYCMPQEQQLLKEQFKLIYENKITQPIQMNLHFVSNNSTHDMIPFKTSAYAFCNPCNDAFEFIICTHTSTNKYNEIPSSNGLAGASNNSILSHNNGTNNSTSSLTMLTNSNNTVNSNTASHLINASSMNTAYSQYNLLNSYQSNPPQQHQQMMNMGSTKTSNMIQQPLVNLTNGVSNSNYPPQQQQQPLNQQQMQPINNIMQANQQPAYATNNYLMMQPKQDYIFQ